ncbi:MAG: R3H domain-containing nucleic acid-binding protein, partial [Anaerolineales bacterium]
MIEAVENHNPEVIVIDEIGRELEAEAARTIAERGVQLIGTAHGNSLENILLNPTLADLIGGIESVTLSDEEARRRGTQKTVLERRAPPTFDVLIEIQEREKLVVHHDVAAAVDSFLRGRTLAPELRFRNAEGEIQVEATSAFAPSRRADGRGREVGAPAWESRTRPSSFTPRGEVRPEATPFHAPTSNSVLQPIRVYAYGIARNRLEQAAKRLRVPASVVDELDEAQALVTLKAYYRKRQKVVSDAEARGLPIYVLRANTVSQMENFLSDLFNLSEPLSEDEDDNVMAETHQAINAVLNGTPSVDLTPASAHVRRLQHEMARKANLISHSYGKEPRRRVRIFRD